MLQKIIDIAKQAGQIQLDYLTKELNVQYKSASQFDAVTDADVASSNHIIKSIKELFPDDFICCEEDIQKNIDWTKRVWIIDPLDGTYSYIHKQDNFSVLIGCIENGIFILGVVYLPLKGEIYYSAKGEGVFYERNGEKKKIEINLKEDLKECTLIYKKPALELPRIKYLYETLNINKELDFTPIGNAIIKIVRGEGDILFLKRGGKRDVAALECILNELGYYLTDTYGKKLDYSQFDDKFTEGIIVSSSQINELLVDMLNDTRLY